MTIRDLISFAAMVNPLICCNNSSKILKTFLLVSMLLYLLLLSIGLWCFCLSKVLDYLNVFFLYSGLIASIVFVSCFKSLAISITAAMLSAKPINSVCHLLSLFSVLYSLYGGFHKDKRGK